MESDLNLSCRSSTTTPLTDVQSGVATYTQCLLDAIETSNLDVFSTLLTLCGLDASHFERNENTPLHQAIRLRERDMTELLLKHTGSLLPQMLCAQDPAGYTPLMCAAQVGDVELMRQLVELGGLTDSSLTLAELPIEEQTYGKNSSTIPALMLIETRGDISQAFELAVIYENIEAAHLFFYAGANTLPALEKRGEKLNQLMWIAENRFFHAHDLLSVLQDAQQCGDTATIAFLIQPRIVLPTLNLMAESTDDHKKEVLKLLISAGVNAEDLVAAIVKQLKEKLDYWEHVSMPDELDTLRLLCSIDASATSIIVELVDSGRRTNLWIMRCIVDYGADALPALRALRQAKAPQQDQLAHHMIANILRTPELSDEKKISKLKQVIVEDLWNVAEAQTTKLLINGQPLKDIRLLLQAGVSTNDQLLAALADRTLDFDGERVTISAPRNEEPLMAHQLLREQIQAGADFLSTAISISNDISHLALNDNNTEQIRRRLNALKSIVHIALQHLLSNAQMSQEETAEALKKWITHEPIRFVMSELSERIASEFPSEWITSVLLPTPPNDAAHPTHKVLDSTPP